MSHLPSRHGMRGGKHGRWTRRQDDQWDYGSTRWYITLMAKKIAFHSVNTRAATAYKSSNEIILLVPIHASREPNTLFPGFETPRLFCFFFCVEQPHNAQTLPPPPPLNQKPQTLYTDSFQRLRLSHLLRNNLTRVIIA